MALATTYFYSGQYKEAYPLLERICINNANKEAFALLGRCYLELDKIDLAAKYLPSNLENASVPELTLYYQYNRVQKNFLNAMVGMDSVLHRTDRILSNSLDQTFSQTLQDYYKTKQELQQLKLKNTRLSRTISVLILVILVCFLSVGIFYVSKRARQDRQKHVEEARVLKENIVSQQQIITLKQKRLQELISKRYAVFDRLCQVYYENQTVKALPDKLSLSMNALIDEFSDAEKNIEEFGALLDADFDGVFTHLIEDFPKIKQEDKLVFIFAAIGFSAGPASLFLRKNKAEYIYNHRTRLRAKINSLDSANKELYLQLLG